MTTGMRTSEFWVTIIVANLMLFAKALGLDVEEGTLMNITAMVIAYIGGRTWAKK